MNTEKKTHAHTNPIYENNKNNANSERVLVPKVSTNAEREGEQWLASTQTFHYLILAMLFRKTLC